jgi:Tfp pilus assembly protein PilE
MYQTYACARCGFVNPTHARACAECGTPNPHPSPFLPPPPNAIGTPGAPAGSGGPNVAKWLIGLGALGCGGIVVIGVLAAIAIPKFAGVSKRAKEMEARPVLRYVQTLQNDHHAEHGTYTADLAAMGLTEAPGFGMKYFTISVSEASTSDLCVDAIPNDAGRMADLRTFSMDEAGVIYEGPMCQVPLVDDYGAGSTVYDEPAPAWEETDTTALPMDGAPADEGKPDPASKAPKP